MIIQQSFKILCTYDIRIVFNINILRLRNRTETSINNYVTFDWHYVCFAEFLALFESLEEEWQGIKEKCPTSTHHNLYPGPFTVYRNTQSECRCRIPQQKPNNTCYVSHETTRTVFELAGIRQHWYISYKIKIIFGMQCKKPLYWNPATWICKNSSSNV